MRKRGASLAVVLLSAVFILAACSAEANPEFLGRWLRAPAEGGGTMGAQIYTFESGGEGVFHDGRLAHLGVNETQILWNVDGDRLEIFFGGQLRVNVYYFEFQDEDTLVLRRAGWPERTGAVLTRVQD